MGGTRHARTWLGGWVKSLGREIVQLLRTLVYTMGLLYLYHVSIYIYTYVGMYIFYSNYSLQTKQLWRLS